MTEAELCQQFRTWAEARGWLVHPEVSNWDMVLVPSSMGVHDDSALGDLVKSPCFTPGQSDQVGVQAKLLGNVDVLAQALGDRRTGPSWRLVVVPRPSTNFIEVARHLGMMVAANEVKTGYHGFARGLPAKWRQAPDGFKIHGRGAPVLVNKQLTLPPIVTNLVAGGPSPKQLTPWRVKALRLCRLLRTAGYLTPEDFKREKVDKRVWVERWLDICKDSGTITYTVRAGAELPDEGFEEISAALAVHEFGV